MKSMKHLKNNLLKLVQDHKENLNSLVSILKIVFVFKNLSTKKTPGPGDFAGKAYQTFQGKNEIIYRSK